MHRNLTDVAILLPVMCSIMDWCIGLLETSEAKLVKEHVTNVDKGGPSKILEAEKQIQ